MRKEIISEFYDAFVHFMALSKQQLFAIADEYDLTSAQAFMLMLMHSNDGKPMSSFCSLLGCDASNITGLVDGLERKKLLMRSEHPDDRRIKVVKLLPDGIALRAKILARLTDQHQGYIMSKLSEDELKQFTKLIEKITRDCPAAQPKKAATTAQA